MALRGEPKNNENNIRQTANEINALCLIAFLKFTNQLNKADASGQEKVVSAKKAIDAANDEIDKIIKLAINIDKNDPMYLKNLTAIKNSLRPIIDKVLNNQPLRSDEQEMISTHNITQAVLNDITVHSNIIKEATNSTKDVKKLQEPKESIENIAATQALVSHIITDINTPFLNSQKAKRIEFWAEVMNVMQNDGNFYGARSINIAMNDAAINAKAMKLTSAETKVTLSASKDLFNNNKHLVNEMTSKQSQGHAVIPTFNSQSGQLVQRSAASDAKGWNEIVNYLEKFTANISGMLNNAQNGSLIQQLINNATDKTDSAKQSFNTLNQLSIQIDGNRVDIKTNDLIAALNNQDQSQKKNQIMQAAAVQNKVTPPEKPSIPIYIGPKRTLNATGMNRLCVNILKDLQLDPNNAMKKSLDNAFRILKNREPVANPPILTSSLPSTQAMHDALMTRPVLETQALNKEVQAAKAIKQIINYLEANGAKPEDMRKLASGFDNHLRKMSRDARKLYDPALKAEITQLKFNRNSPGMSTNVDLELLIKCAKEEKEKFANQHQNADWLDNDTVAQGIKLNDAIIQLLVRQRDACLIRIDQLPDNNKGKEELIVPPHEQAIISSINREIEELQNEKYDMNQNKMLPSPRNSLMQQTENNRSATNQIAAVSTAPTLKERWDRFKNLFKREPNKPASFPVMAKPMGSSSTSHIATAFGGDGKQTLKNASVSQKTSASRPAMEPVELPKAELTAVNEVEPVTQKLKK